MVRYLDPINVNGSAPETSSGGRLDETCNLVVNSEALIDLYSPEIVEERLLWCVLHSKFPKVHPNHIQRMSARTRT